MSIGRIRLGPSAVAVAVVLSTFALGGCARQISPGVVAGPAVGEAIATYSGTVQGVRVVSVQESETLEGNRTGIALGGIGGGLAGAQVGAGWGRVAAIGAGAVAGAALGAFTEQQLKKQSAFEYVVRLDDGRLMTIVQGLEPRLAPGQRVYVQAASRGRARVVPIS